VAKEKLSDREPDGVYIFANLMGTLFDLLQYEHNAIGNGEIVFSKPVQLISFYARKNRYDLYLRNRPPGDKSTTFSFEARSKGAKIYTITHKDDKSTFNKWVSDSDRTT
jgi:hypothetical protein